MVGLNRGFVSGTPMPSAWKRRQAKLIPDAAGDDPHYRMGLTAGEFLGAVMSELAMSFRHSELADLSALCGFAMHYSTSMNLPAGSQTVLLWIRDAPTMFRAHAAACYLAESHCVGIGEGIELEFLRALAKRTGQPLPSDAEALVAERRRDAKNLPTGLDWATLPEPPIVGGPLDGARTVDVDAAAELRRRLRLLEHKVILDQNGDGAFLQRGMVAGLTAAGRVPILITGTSEPPFHRGRLAGSLEAALVCSRGKIPAALTNAAYIYARALDMPGVRPLLSRPAPDNLLGADAFARYVVRDQHRVQLEDADALAFFYWLADQLDVGVTPTVLTKRERIVVRSIEQQPPDPPKSTDG